jgi:hypothetical protein
MSQPRLATPADRDVLVARLMTLTSDAPRQWGRMTCQQMFVHLTDAFRLVTGERPAQKNYDNLLTRTVGVWLFLRADFPFPKGSPTLPSFDQLKGGGSPTTSFDADREALIASIDRFVALHSDGKRPKHPLFGALSGDDWARWGWKHTDHHLRQFGV